MSHSNVSLCDVGTHTSPCIYVNTVNISIFHCEYLHYLLVSLCDVCRRVFAYIYMSHSNTGRNHICATNAYFFVNIYKIYLWVYVTCVHVCWHTFIWLTQTQDEVIYAPRLIHLCVATHLYVCHDSFICVTWLIHVCDMTHSYVWHDSFICVTWLIHLCAMTHSSMRRDSFVCVPCSSYISSFICVP